MLSNKQRLSASDRGLIKQHPDVASNSKKPRMRAAMAINQNQVRLGAQARESSQERWTLTEREQSRNIRELQLLLRESALNLFKPRQAINDDAGKGCFGFRIERQIGPGDGANLLKAIFFHHLRAQFLLQAHRFARGQIPSGAQLGLHSLRF